MSAVEEDDTFASSNKRIKRILSIYLQCLIKNIKKQYLIIHETINKKK
jgi:hypothetical protein